jgi:hypothetical protein
MDFDEMAAKAILGEWMRLGERFARPQSSKPKTSCLSTSATRARRLRLADGA